MRNFALIRASKVYLEHWEVGYGKHDDVSIDGIFLQGGLSEKIEWGIKKESLFYNIFSPVFFSSHHPIINQPNRTTLWYGKKWYSLGKQQSHRQKTCFAVGSNAVCRFTVQFWQFWKVEVCIVKRFDFSRQTYVPGLEQIQNLFYFEFDPGTESLRKHSFVNNYFFNHFQVYVDFRKQLLKEFNFYIQI